MGEKPAHAMSVEEVLAFYGSNPETGLNSKEHAAALEKYGANELPEEEVTPLWKLILEQFEDLVVIILLAAAAVSFGLALLEDSEDQLQAFFEPAVILIILFVNAFIGVMQESNAEAAIRALKAYEPDHATVVRNGKEARVEAATVVPGDIVHVAVGDKIPADLRLLSITSTTLRCDQALLTGEAYSVGKVTEAVSLEGAVNQDKINILFSGTAVTNGSAVCVAVGTGSNTAIGDIQLTLMDTETTLSPMKVKLDEFGELLAKVILYICIAVWIINIGHFSDPAHGGWVKGAIYYFKIAVALAVAAIPEGLPAVVTTCLALGTKRMAAKNAIVRSLPSVETLGCTTVICSDKTGTLTTNKMSVKKVVTFGSAGELVIREVEGTTYSPVGDVTLLSEEESEETGETIYSSVVEEHPSGSSVSLSQFCTVMSLCNGSNVIGNDATGEFEIIGEPTEAALRVLTEKCGTSAVSPLEFESSPASERATAIHDSLLSQYSTKATLEFTRDRKSMSVIVSTDRDEHHLFVKGAPENIVERCSSVFLEGQIVPLTAEKRAEFLTKVKELGTGADTLRVLAGAMVPNCGTVESMDLSAPENFVNYETDMVLLGCAGMLDPPRMEVAPAIAECHGAGIRVMVITGDNKDTAIAIARRIGVFSAEEDTEGLAFTGREFDALSKAEKIEAVSRAKLFARVEPAHKSEIVKILMQDLGEVAAMTGDGVNDAPALKAANIGIAMGSGTEVAKGASDMVLADDNFTTIVSAVAEGRAIFNNTTAFIRYLVSSNIGEVASIFITAAVGMPEALVPVQLLWVNLVTDGLPATALGFNPNDDDIMKKPPRKNDEPMIDTWMFIRYMVVGTYVGISTVLGFAWWYMWYAEGPQMGWSDLSNFHSCVEVAGRGWGCDVFDLANGSTISLTILVVCETMNAFNAISANQSLLKTGIFANWYLVGASIISLALHFMILYVDFFNDIFSIVPLNWAEWQAVLWFSLPVVIIDELAKCFARRRLAATKKLEKKMA